MTPNRSAPDTGSALFVFAALASASGVVLYNLLVEGPFVWHFTVPSAVQGGVEALVLIAALALAAIVRHNAARCFIVLALLALYLRRHHVDLPALVAMFYFEGLMALGAVAMLGADLRRRRLAAPLLALLLGVLVWSLLLWTMQVAGEGRPRAARIALPAILLPALLLAWRHTASVRFVRWQARTSTAARAASFALLGWFAVLAARTNNVLTHDSLWYGLRAEQVLVGARSVFDPVGLVSPVHYYPKVWEVLQLPASAMGEFSFVLMLTPIALGVVTWLCFGAARRLGAGTAWALLAAAVVATLPALANQALDAKPDVMAAALLLGGACLALDPARLGRNGRWMWILAMALVAVCCKISVAPFALALAVPTMLLGLWQDPRLTQLRSRHYARAGALALLLAMGVAVLATARTYVLAGAPTVGPEQALALWKVLGMTLAEPVGTLTWTSAPVWSEVPVLLWDWVARPARMEHIIISWPGNVWLVCALLALAAALRHRDTAPRRWTWYPVIAAGVALLVLVRFAIRGGDGNYFIVPVACLALLAMVAAMRRLAGRARLGLAAGLLLTATFQAAYGFVSAGWSQPGTRTFDLDLTQSCWDTEARRERELDVLKLTDVAGFLAAYPRGTHVIGIPNDTDAGWLERRYESMLSIAFSRGEYTVTEAGFRRYLAISGVDYLLLPPQMPDWSTQWLPGVLAVLQAAPASAVVYSDAHFRLLDAQVLRDKTAAAGP